MRPAPPFPPLEPPRSRVKFPDPGRAGAPEVLATGCVFEPGTLLLAYRSGIFPWPHGEAGDGEPLVLWFSPEPRAIFPLESAPHWSRSLRRTLRNHPYEITFDADFRQVIHACGATRPKGTWIIPELVAGYLELHERGWAHSVEVWEKPTRAHGERMLVGGIYGIAIGGMFAGESMFHLRTDASKIAFASLAEKLRASGFALFDVQVQNDHLESLGCVEVTRAEYLARLRTALPLRPQLT